MIGRWFRRKLELKAAKAAREDIERFIAGLEGASEQELGYVVAQAAVVRMMCRRDNLLPDAALFVGQPLSEDERLLVQKFLADLVNGFQTKARSDPSTDAASFALGAMVWLHSMRAVTFPEIRVLGRKMWRELERGFAYADEALETLESPTGEPLPDGVAQNLTFVPPGLEPA